MYRVQNDKRCIESCELLYQALLKTILSESFSGSLRSISVSELTRKAAVSRGTFYRHFDQVIDVLIWKSDYKMSKSCSTQLILKNNKQFCKGFYEYWSAQHLFLNSLLRISRLDLLLSSLEINIASWSHFLFRNAGLSGITKDYLIRIWAVINWSILCTWIRRGRKECPDELAKLAIHNLPDIWNKGGSLETTTVITPTTTVAFLSDVTYA